MNRVLASASADQLRKGLWEVKVHGGLWPSDQTAPILCPDDYRRTYSVETTTEGRAVFEAMDQFRDEIENLTGQ